MYLLVYTVANAHRHVHRAVMLGSQSMGTRGSSVVERPLMVSWVVGTIPHGGHIEIFLVPASTPTGVINVV